MKYRMYNIDEKSLRLFDNLLIKIFNRQNLNTITLIILAQIIIMESTKPKAMLEEPVVVAPQQEELKKQASSTKQPKSLADILDSMKITETVTAITL